MRNLILILILLAAGWFAYDWLKKQSTPEKLRQSVPVRYAKALEADVKKAEEARDKADAAIKRETESVRKAVHEAEDR